MTDSFENQILDAVRPLMERVKREAYDAGQRDALASLIQSAQSRLQHAREAADLVPFIDSPAIKGQKASERETIPRKRSPNGIVRDMVREIIEASPEGLRPVTIIEMADGFHDFDLTFSVFRWAARRTDCAAGIPVLESAPVSEKRVGLTRSPCRRGYGHCMLPDPLPMLHRSIPDGSSKPRTAAIWPSGHPHGLNLIASALCGRTGGCRSSSVSAPTKRATRLHAVGALIPGHDVFGTGWQILGRAMQSITTMVPVRQCGHTRNDRPVSASKRSRSSAGGSAAGAAGTIPRSSRQRSSFCARWQLPRKPKYLMR